MASANISPSEEQFLCSICLDVFNEPVSTPCGHNYCKGCITSYWSSRNCSECPLCKENFHNVPELQVNTELRDMVELFKMKKVAGDDSSSTAGPGDVPCDVCHGIKRKAVKSCLTCLVSYCSAHLEPHHTQAFKWHELINPVKTLEDRVCKKHNKVMEFYCKKDQSCVCLMCLRDDHVMHSAISLEEEFKERKTMLKFVKRQVKHTVSEKCNTTKRIQNSMKQGRQEVEKVKVETVKAFAVLSASIETKKVKLIELLEEKQKAAEQHAEALIRQLQLEIAENHQMSTKLEELSSNEDNFRLLQDLPSFSPPSNTTHRITERVQRFLQAETLWSVIAKMEDMLNEQMENVIQAVNLVDKDETVEESMKTQTVNAFDDELGKIQEQYAIEVSLDPDTAHPSLIVSGDRKQVRDGSTKRRVPDNPTRFDSFHFVLGNEGFSSGKFYYEVTLTGQTGWEVGVARESVNRKGAGLSLSPENGCWTLGSYWGNCQANANPPVKLSLSQQPQNLGVFVDYEGGLVSFYDVDTRAVIYSFTGCAFTASGTFLGNLLAFRVYNSGKTRIYPLFRPSAEWSDSAPLQITPVRCTKGK
ncbi:E3 ubiquitin-protein ligase TRIM41-like [Epinephelus moara]|uniref:E3 ubiquitin-protein ligase TRIM41-like n=1 Tax=Epinephelus moara TaxID=300413 RepID=UPI00214EDE5C|nr:E3 ubiquitin-protein ligase TRIM41-like [Epinephelus moara]XP_049921622.1 E3 ubiquitin-protein ligase TRIM41-like [Epinephelus moara]